MCASGSDRTPECRFSPISNVPASPCITVIAEISFPQLQTETFDV
jgi:hypothetical protein